MGSGGGGEGFVGKRWAIPTAASCLTAATRLPVYPSRLIPSDGRRPSLNARYSCKLGARATEGLMRPGKIIGVGRNYVEHAAELGNAVPERPLLFFKQPTAVIGNGEAIVLPPESAQVDFEAEIRVVIGTRRRRGTEAQAPAANA